MLRIGRLGHVAHVVGDLKAADRWYDEVFSGHRFYKRYLEAAMREASLIAIGDFVLEPMMSSPVPGAERTPLAKFYNRFGPRFHSIAWYVDSVPDTFASLKHRGVKLLNITGTALDSTPARESPMFTHPRDTFGQLEFAEPGIVDDPRLRLGWSSAYWRDIHPLGIERASHITVLARDLDRAGAFFAGTLDGKPFHQDDSGPGNKTRYYLIGEDTVIGTAMPLSSASDAGQELEKNGEVIFSVTFKVKDLNRAESFLRAKGLRVRDRTADSFVVNKDDALGLVLAFTQRSLPNDPRK